MWGWTSNRPHAPGAAKFHPEDWGTDTLADWVPVRVPVPLHRLKKTPRQVSCSFEDFLRKYQPVGMLILKEWLLYMRPHVADLFQHPEDYSELVVWIALCGLKFTVEQAEAIRGFLTNRVIQKLKWSNPEKLRKHLGITVQRDNTYRHVPATGTEIESDLYDHFVADVLNDVYVVRTNCLGYLYSAARNYQLNLYKRAKSRPALEGVPPPSNAEGERSEDETALDKLATDQQRQKAEAEREAVESKLDMDRLLDQTNLTPRERELAVLLCQPSQLTQKEIARRMHVTPARISQMIKQLASNPVLKQAYARL